MPAMNINKNNFQNEVMNADKPVLLDFWAPWCPYCRRIAPVYDKVAAQYQDRLTAGKVNYEEEPQLIERLGIDSIPTLMLFRNGKAEASISAPGSKAEI